MSTGELLFLWLVAGCLFLLGSVILLWFGLP
jgi:hypothetical protein